jgi:formylmethanofuran dehydrogenase subunit E
MTAEYEAYVERIAENMILATPQLLVRALVKCERCGERFSWLLNSRKLCDECRQKESYPLGRKATG